MKPFVTCARDYHDFPDIAKILCHEHNVKNIEYKEIGCGHSDLHPSGKFYYHAVFFLSEDSDSEIVKKLMEDCKTELISYVDVEK